MMQVLDSDMSHVTCFSREKNHKRERENMAFALYDIGILLIDNFMYQYQYLPFVT